MNNYQKLLKAASFAAIKHSNQRRKGNVEEPYINHPIEVARILAEIGGVDDVDLLIAAILHDTVEDTDTTLAELTELFGARVAGFVAEVTDDKLLSKTERKQYQIEHAPHLSIEAKQLKIADKSSNFADIIRNPPANWSIERQIDYIDWGEKVMVGLRGANESLEKLFDDLAAQAKLSFREVSDSKPNLD